MVALIGKVAKKLKRLLPTLYRVADRKSRQLFQGAEHSLDHAVFIAKNLGRFLRFVRAATSMRNCWFHLMISFHGSLNADIIAALSRPAALPFGADRAKQQVDRRSKDRCAWN